MSTKTPEKPEEAPVCELPLCGKRADWKIDFFGRTEYYCDGHKPIIPSGFLKRVESAPRQHLQ